MLSYQDDKISFWILMRYLSCLLLKVMQSTFTFCRHRHSLRVILIVRKYILIKKKNHILGYLIKFSPWVVLNFLVGAKNIQADKCIHPAKEIYHNLHGKMSDEQYFAKCILCRPLSTIVSADVRCFGILACNLSNQFNSRLFFPSVTAPYTI